ncbi:hypothetical protein BH23BAC2_BH23BAC2_23030 [soil metagenome]
MFLDISHFYWQSLMVAILVLPIIALVHMLRNNFKGKHKLIWVLIILFLPLFGSILYFIMGKRYRRENPLKNDN